MQHGGGLQHHHHAGHVLHTSQSDESTIHVHTDGSSSSIGLIATAWAPLIKVVFPPPLLFESSLIPSPCLDSPLRPPQRIA